MKKPESRPFSLWHDAEYNDLWDPDNPPVPDHRCMATSPQIAAERFAEEDDSNFQEFIVKDDEAGTYYLIKLSRSWTVHTLYSVELSELCEP